MNFGSETSEHKR